MSFAFSAPLVPENAISPHHSQVLAAALTADWETEVTTGDRPIPWGSWVQDTFGLDLTADYAGRRLPHPLGKASGQLSLRPEQVAADRSAGLAFVVLKTVIGEDSLGNRSMAAWSVPESRMRVEPIVGMTGTPGWTVTWLGRGWAGDLGSYGRFFGRALEVAGSDLLVVPSVKVHLPGPDEVGFRVGEYEHTVGELLAQHRRRHCGIPMPLEKDFSPTLAGDDRASQAELILNWVVEAPNRLKAVASSELSIGVKLMNALQDLPFQQALLQAAEAGPGADYLVYANRLFDPHRAVDGVHGAAYGGPDLSDRNLEILGRRALSGRVRLPVSGTGNIVTGQMAVEYALRGAGNCQMHTVFQLPRRLLAGKSRQRSTAVLQHLFFHPETGLVSAMLRLSDRVGTALRWRDLPELGRELLRERTGRP